jgi:spore coat protein JB
MTTEQECMMLKIQECEFVCIELNLYIDTHPDDEAALNDFNCYSAKLHQLMEAYEKMYGPLLNFGHSAFEVKSWTACPWPWEM